MEAGGLLPRQPPQGPPGTAPGPISLCVGQAPPNNAGNVLGQTAGIHDLNATGQLGLTGQQLQLQQQMGQAPGMGEVLTPKRQAVVDRLRRRIENYRRRQTDCIPRFDQSFNGLCEQNIQDTLVLKQRFLESKAKRQAKKTDKKQSEPVGLSSVHVVSHFSLLACGPLASPLRALLSNPRRATLPGAREPRTRTGRQPSRRTILIANLFLLSCLLFSMHSSFEIVSRFEDPLRSNLNAVLEMITLMGSL